MDFSIVVSPFVPASGAKLSKKLSQDEGFMIPMMNGINNTQNRPLSLICESHRLTDISMDVAGPWMRINRIPRVMLEMTQQITWTVPRATEMPFKSLGYQLFPNRQRDEMSRAFPGPQDDKNRMHLIRCGSIQIHFQMKLMKVNCNMKSNMNKEFEHGEEL
jgi:hypothetical protein